MARANENIRLFAAGKGVSLWRVAAAMGISETWFYRLMRKELTADKEREIVGIIERLAAEDGK